MKYRKIYKIEIPDALELVWRVFLEYEAPDYTEEGINEFKRTIEDDSWVSAREFYGAFDGDYHRRGIGRNLFNMVLELNKDGYFTVNSSPYAHEVYKHLGFFDTDSEQCISGLRFYPMRRIIV